MEEEAVDVRGFIFHAERDRKRPRGSGCIHVALDGHICAMTRSPRSMYGGERDMVLFHTGRDSRIYTYVPDCLLFFNVERRDGGVAKNRICFDFFYLLRAGPGLHRKDCWPYDE